MSGANSTPLGRMNPAIGAGKKTGSSLLNPSYMGNIMSSSTPSQQFSNSSSQKRESSDNESGMSEAELAAERKRRRKSRWQGSEKEKTFIPGMPTVLPSNMNKDQEEAYLLQLQIEELSRRLRSNDLGIPPNPEDRSPSPEPIYNNEGKRLNTREYRTRKKLEDDRHAIIQKMYKLNPEYKPPADYKPPIVKVSDKVMIPQEEHPDINFVGLLIGPRGNTLKSMEKDTGAKIIIRGKGSVKEGKVGRKDGGPMPGEDEPLHAYVTASNPESVKKAVDKIKEIIRQGVEVPEGQNDLRRMQLRELALLNGTLRENDGPRCSNCGSTTHKSWQCPDKPNVTNNVVCTSCGGAGHIAKDCRQRKPGQAPSAGGVDRQKIDEEYLSLMAELGEGPPVPQNKNATNGNGNRLGGSSPAIRSLFDTPVAPPRAILGPPPPGTQGSQMNRPNISSNNLNMGPMNNMGNMNMPMNNANMNNPSNMNMRNQPNNNWSGNQNQSSYNQRSNRPIIGGPNQNQPPNFNRPPPMNWQGQQGGMNQGNNNQNQNSQGFQSGPPPNLLSAPPPPPPPTSSNQGSQQHQQQQPPPPPQQQQQQQSWMNQGPPPGMNSWQGPPTGGPHGAPGMGCPPPGPVPPPRPVGPPPGWGWNGPPQPVGPPPPPPGGPANPNASRGGPSGVDLGALLSAPPPPPPS